MSKKLLKNQQIIGRKKEQQLLKELYDSKRAEFIALYGRRRIGKTFLIKNFIDSLDCVFFHVTGLQKGTLKDQLEEFAKQISTTFYNGANIGTRTRWRDAFEDLTQAISKIPEQKKVVIFFDELPWMATPRSRLLIFLDLYWNRYWSNDSRLKLIICGSATSWIIQKIINNKGGLHNRVTRTIQLQPFTLYETEVYLKDRKIKLNQKQILDLYIVIGGIPFYWSFVQKGLSAAQNIDKLCFQKDGVLFKEFNRLFDSLFDDAKPYSDLIRIIAKHRYGIGQRKLIGESGLPDGGSTIKRLHELEEAGFITSLVPYGHKDRGIYYIIDDEYCLFYLYWIEPNNKTIAKKTDSEGFWLQQSQRSSWKSWVGIAFESVCYKHIDQIRKALDLEAGSIVSTWRYTPRALSESEGAQIDLLFDRPDSSITICEIKYCDTLFLIDKAYAKQLLRKMEIFKQQTRTKKQLFLAFVTTWGLKLTVYTEDLVTNEVKLQDLFKSK